MNLYKVRVYDIGHDKNLGKDILLDTIIVKKDFIGTEEIISKWPIRIVSESTIGKKHPDSYLRPYAYKEFGHDLAVIKEDIKRDNIANEEEIDSYLNSFTNKRIKKVFDQMKVTNNDLEYKIKRKRK